MKKIENIAILTGGDSAEYKISLLSANNVLKNLQKTKYNGTIVHLKNGEFTINNNNKLETLNFSYIQKNKKQQFDKIFIALHGTPAEDGLIQDYFDKLNLPYTCCNAKVSALTFDKFECNQALIRYGFKCANSIAIYHTENKMSEEEIINKIGLPCFVKPNGAGSSYGISKVKKKCNLSKAIEDAFIYDKKVIIESFIKGTEVSCGVYSNGGGINTLPITEIVSKNEFFDYNAKYKGESEEITPARISNKLSLKIQKITTNIYKKMNLTGICRVDFIIKKSDPYIIEINTIPGLSKESIIPKQLEAANISLSEIFDLCLQNIN